MILAADTKYATNVSTIFIKASRQSLARIQENNEQ